MHSYRTLALAGMLCLCGCFSEGDTEDSRTNPDGTVSGLRVVIEPTRVAARQNSSTVVRIDVPDVAERDLPSGYSVDLPEQVAHIDITTAPCPVGVGSRACQDWTITPREGSLPAGYNIHVSTVGSRAGTASGSFRLQVVTDPRANHGGAVAIDAARLVPAAQRLVLNADGQVFVHGYNNTAESRILYQRNNGDDTVLEPAQLDEFVAAPLPADSRWIEVRALDNVSLAVRDDGTVWAWGRNSLGSLGFRPAASEGLGRTDRQVFARQLPALTNVRSVLPVRLHAADRELYLQLVALLADGRIVIWSADAPEELLPACEDDYQIGKVECDEEVSDVRSIHGSTDFFNDVLAVKNDGTTWDLLQLSIPERRIAFMTEESEDEAPRPVMSALNLRNISVYLSGDRTVWLRSNTQTLERVSGLDDVTAIAADPQRNFIAEDNIPSFNRYVLYALRGDGTVWTWRIEEEDGAVPLRTSTPVQVSGLTGIVTLGPGFAIANNCVGGGGGVWRIRADSDDLQPGDPELEPIPGFGDSATCDAPTMVQVRVSVSGNGRIVSTPSGIDCSTDCTGSFPLGSIVQLHEAPAIGSEFAGFDGNSECGGRVTRDLHCGARFRRGGERRLEVRVEGDGRATTDPAGIDCGIDCSQSYDVGRSVQLIATPGLGYRLGSYTGHEDCSEGILFMIGVRSCVVRFVPLPAPNTPTGFVATPSGNGTLLNWDAVLGPVMRYTIERADASDVFIRLLSLEGDAAQATDLSALPNTIYTYRLIAENVSGASPPATTVATTLPATQGRLTVTISSALPDAGLVTSTPAGINCGVDCTEVYAIGTQVSLIATPGAGQQFNGFSGDADCTDGLVTITAATITCSATFATSSSGSGWVLLGGSSLTVSGVAPSPSVAIGPGNVPFVAYSEAVPAGDVARLRVQRFDGNAWVPVGPAVNAGSLNAAFEPSLAFSPTGIPHIAWASSSATQRNILVARFNGAAWERVGPDMPLNYTPGALASNPSLAFGTNGAPMVAWVENSAVKFKLFSGTAWVRAEGPGGAEGPVSSAASRVKLSTFPANGTPVLAWSEGSSSSRRIRASSGLDFELLASAVTPQLPLDSSLTEFDVVAIASSQITVTWAQVGTLHSILAREWTGSTWSDLTAPVSNASQPFLSFSMSRNREELVYSADVPVTNQSSARLFHRAFSSFIPSGLPSLSVPRAEGLRALSIATPGIGAPVVAGSFVNSQDRHELRVYAVFP